jgi:hypothetical protein
LKSIYFALFALFTGFLVLIQPASAQTDPALKTSVERVLDAYLTSGGPSKDELDSGSDLANWSILKDLGVPGFLKNDSLRKGDWKAIWQPLEDVLDDYDLSKKLRPLQVLAFWEESSKDHSRFVRLLGREKILDPKQPAQRNRGRRLREAVGEIHSKLSPIRTNARYEEAGWRFTANASLEPGARIVRVAITGSQPCKITGSARTASLTLKGRLFEDLGSKAGVKVQILDRSFKSKGCELNLRDRVSTVARLAGGGEAKTVGSLNIVFQDELVTGRFQIDIVSKQVGVALLTGRAVYTIRGKVTRDGKLEAALIPVSRSGSRVLHQSLELEGTLTGTVGNSAGRGQIVLPVLKDPLSWKSEPASGDRK